MICSNHTAKLFPNYSHDPYSRCSNLYLVILLRFSGNRTSLSKKARIGGSISQSIDLLSRSDRDKIWWRWTEFLNIHHPAISYLMMI
jgi:hypothetical protein